LRSVSGGLCRDPEPVQKIQRIVENQQEFILELLSEHRAEVEEKLQQRSRRFGSRQIEKQYQINSQHKELVIKTQTALSNNDTGKAKELIQLLAEQIEEHKQDLIIADSSPHS
jgi:archaellum biogenesis ATPase FlaH